MSIVRAAVLSRYTLPAFAAQGIAVGTFAAYVPELKARTGASDAEFGLALLVAAAGALMAMSLAPRFDRGIGRGGMALAAVLLGLAAVPPALADSVLAFALAMGFFGAGAGLLDIVMNARVTVNEGRSGTSVMNLNHAFYSAAYAAAALSSGATRELGFGPVAALGGVMVLLLAGSALAIEPRPQAAAAARSPSPVAAPSRDQRASGAEASRSGRRQIIWFFGLIVLVAFMAENATEGWSALHIERTLNGGAAEGALGPAMLGLTMMAGRMSGQFALARFTETALMGLGAGLAALGAMLAAAAPIPAVAYAGFGILGLGVSVIAPMALALVGRSVGNAARTAAISRVSIIGYMGFFLGPPIMGLISQVAGLRAAFLAVALVLGAIPLLVSLARR